MIAHFGSADLQIDIVLPYTDTPYCVMATARSVPLRAAHFETSRGNQGPLSQPRTERET